MKFIPQFPIQQLSGHDGNINGLVAMKLNGIDVFRRYAIPTNPDTSEQQAARTVFTVASQNFQNLTDAQRATWTTFAQLDPVRVLGRDITLQDMACYVRSDFWKYHLDSAHLANAPTALPGYVVTDITSISQDSGTGDMEIQFTHNGVAATGKWIVKVTNALASAQRNARPNEFRLIEGMAGDSVVAVAASPTAQTFDNPLNTYTNNDYVEVEITPLSDDFAIGTPFSKKLQITVA